MSLLSKLAHDWKGGSIALLGIGKRTGPDKPYGGRAPMESRVSAERWGNGWK